MPMTLRLPETDGSPAPYRPHGWVVTGGNALFAAQSNSSRRAGEAKPATYIKMESGFATWHVARTLSDHLFGRVGQPRLSLVGASDRRSFA